MDFTVHTRWVVYTLRSGDGEPFYVGMGAPDRPYKHISQAYLVVHRKPNARGELHITNWAILGRIINLWDKDDKVQIQIEGQFTNKRSALDAERALIRAFNESGADLVNIQHIRTKNQIRREIEHADDK